MEVIEKENCPLILLLVPLICFDAGWRYVSNVGDATRWLDVYTQAV